MRLTLIVTFTLLCGSVYLNFKLAEVRTTTTYTEISQSCETGHFFYRVKYPQALSKKEAYKRTQFIHSMCGDFTRLYLNIKKD